MPEFVIFLSPVEGAAPPTRETVAEHCRRLAELGRGGKLIAAGPFTDATGGGMLVVRFESIEAARSFAEGDPFVTSGFETFEVRSWAWSRPENGHLGVLDPAPGTFPGFLETLALRPTTRRFADKPVAETLVRTVLDAALAAPSEFNIQPWRPVVCHAEKDRRRLMACCCDQPQVGACGVAVVLAVDPAAFYDDAPRVVDEFIAAGRWPADRRQTQIEFVRSGEDPRAARDSAIRNATIFGHQLLLAGFSQGLAGFWLGGFDEAAVKREFGIPERAVIAGVVGLGWPERHDRPMPRLAVDAVVGWGHWVMPQVNRSSSS